MTDLERRALTFISPSSSEILRTCFLQLLFSRQGRLSKRSSNPYLRLGIVAHSMMQMAALGVFSNCPLEAADARFDEEWERAVESQETERGDEESHFGPLRQWHTYELTRARTKLVARDVAARTPARQYLEQEFSSAGGRLKGSPDRLVEESGHLVIEDYKTGAIYEADGTDEQQLKPGYRRQMLMYAAIIGEALSEWPTTARIIPLWGPVEEFVIDVVDAAALAAESLHLMDDYNERIERSPDLRLAQPTEEHCVSCPYQTRCEAHWISASSAWTRYASVEGTVEHKETSANGFVAVKLRVERGTLEQIEVIIAKMDPKRFPQLDLIAVGAQLRATKLRLVKGSAVPGAFTHVSSMPVA